MRKMRYIHRISLCFQEILSSEVINLFYPSLQRVETRVECFEYKMNPVLESIYLLQTCAISFIGLLRGISDCYNQL